VTWSSPVVIAHDAELEASATGSDGRVAVVFGVQDGAVDFGGVRSSVGLGLFVAGPDGGIAGPVLLSSSATANEPAVAIGAGRPVVAWLDQGAAAGQRSVWVWDSLSSITPGAQQLSANGVSPAVAADDKGDVVVAWVDGSSREVMASWSIAGGAFGAPEVVSPGESTEYSPVATMDAQGTATIAWQAEGPAGTQPGGTSSPLGLVMAASADPGKPFTAPVTALTGPSGALVHDLSIQSESSGPVLVDATIMSMPSWSDPSGSPEMTYATADPGGAFTPQLQLSSSPSNFESSAGWATTNGGALEAQAANDAGGNGELSTTQIAPGGAIATSAPFQFTPPDFGSVFSLAPGLDSNGDAIVPFTTFSTMQPGSFGNPTAGSILSVVEPAGSDSWCPAQTVSGLMSPFFPIAAGFGPGDHGVLIYQQTPWGELAAAYLTPQTGCGPAAGAIPIEVASSASASRTLRSASIAATCIASGGCKGKLVLLDSSARTLASGGIAAPDRGSELVQLRLTSLGRRTLRQHRRIHAKVQLVTGRDHRDLRQITLTRS